MASHIPRSDSAIVLEERVLAEGGAVVVCLGERNSINLNRSSHQMGGTMLTSSSWSLTSMVASVRRKGDDDCPHALMNLHSELRKSKGNGESSAACSRCPTKPRATWK